MDTKVIVGIVAAVIVVGAIAGVIIATHGGDDDSGDHGYTTLARTNELFPGHTCCVIIGKDSYMSAHPDETTRFLAGYVKGVDYLNTALADKNSEQYKKVMEVAKSQLKDTGISDAEIEQSLANITYLYQDGPGGDLTGLTSDVTALLNSLTFERNPDKTKIMSEFVDGTYIGNVSTATAGTAATISVTVITGDIHQIGLHLANQLGFFSEYGINLSISYGANGGAVATKVMGTGDNGTDFGLLGAPPATITTVNNQLIEDSSKADVKFHIVARVNSEGSGLYIKESVLDDKNADIPARNGVPFYAKSGTHYVVTTENAAAWGGLVFATPGMTSIQHVQLSQLATMMGLKFELFKEGESLKADTIYFITNLATSDKVFANVNVNAGIIWEPQFQRIITE